MALEDIGSVEHSERAEIPFANTFKEAIGCLIESRERGEVFEPNAKPIFDLVFECVAVSLDEARNLVRGLGETAAGLESVLGEYAETFARACEAADTALGRGAEWLQEHRDVLEAVARVAVLVAFCIQAPEIGVAFVTEDPSRVLGPLAVINEAMRNG